MLKTAYVHGQIKALRQLGLGGLSKSAEASGTRRVQQALTKTAGLMDAALPGAVGGATIGGLRAARQAEEGDEASAALRGALLGGGLGGAGSLAGAAGGGLLGEGLARAGGLEGMQALGPALYGGGLGYLGGSMAGGYGGGELASPDKTASAPPNIPLGVATLTAPGMVGAGLDAATGDYEGERGEALARGALPAAMFGVPGAVMGGIAGGELGGMAGIKGGRGAANIPAMVGMGLGGAGAGYLASRAVNAD